jgi:hypothetical protein
LPAGDRGQFVAHPGRQQQAFCPVLFAVSIGDAEAILFGFRLARPGIAPGDGRIGQQLRLGFGNDGCRLAPVLAEETMRMTGKAVAALAFVDHQDVAARPRQLQSGREAGETAADDDGVIGFCGVWHGPVSGRRSGG